MASRYSEILFLLCLMVGVFVFWQSAGTIPDTPRYAQVDAAMWPRMILAALAVTTGLLLAQKIAALRSGAPAAAAPAAQARPYFLRLAAIAGLILLYYFGLRYVGFFVATLAFVWAASSVLPFARPVVKLVFAPAFTLTLGFFFSRALSLPLPRGKGVFYAFSTWLF